MYQNPMNPYGYNPYQYSQPTSLAQQSLTRVNGIEGAKAYQMGPNSQVALFDANEDVMYIKVTDGAGFPSIRTFSFMERVPNKIAEDNKEYVTRGEMEQYVEQFISTNKSSKQAVSAKTVSSVNSES